MLNIPKFVARFVALIGESKVQLLLPSLLGRPLHSPLVTIERREFMRSRIHVICLAFAILVIAWIPMDITAFPRDIWSGLMVARTAAGLSFLLLAYLTRPGGRSLLVVGHTAIMFFIPASFAGYSHIILDSATQFEGWSLFIFTAYDLVPFIIIGGFSLLPLTVFEVFVIAAPIFVTFFTIEFSSTSNAELYQLLGEIWLLLLILGTATLAGISQLHLMISLVEKNAQDPLTLAYTRRDGERVLCTAFTDARDYDRPLGIAFIDLDHFKAVNDNFGHEAGDRVLQMSTKAIMERVRTTDFLVRWGGEEFLLVTPGTKDANLEPFVARVVGRALGNRPDNTALTASVGLSERERDQCSTYEDLVRLADDRMYRAKEAGRNRIVGWEE